MLIIIIKKLKLTVYFLVYNNRKKPIKLAINFVVDWSILNCGNYKQRAALGYDIEKHGTC